MKKGIIQLQLIAFPLLFLLGISTPVYSQVIETDYFKSWTTWMVAFQNNKTNDGKLDKLFCIAFQDSLIDGVQYKKVYVGKHGSLLDYWGQEDTVLCYRQDGKRIYRYDNKYHSDIQIYEFGLSKGDVTTSCGFEMVVDSVFPANKLTDYCYFPDNVMAYRLLDEENPKYTDIWIDGVGSIKTGILIAPDLPANSSSSIVYYIRWRDGSIYFDLDTDEEKLVPFEAIEFTLDDYNIDDNWNDHYEFEFIEDTLHVFGQAWMVANNVNIMDCILNENTVNLEIIPVYRMGGVDNPNMYLFDVKLPGFNPGTYDIIYYEDNQKKDTTITCNGTTGIESPITSDTQPTGFDSNTIYDLSGRCLNTIPERGIYIQNGKKYIVK